MQLGPDTSGTELITGGPLVALVRRPEGDSPAQGSPVLVMIHGFGANEGDIYELVPFVDKRVMIVAPRGPMQVDDNPRGSWRWVMNGEDGRPLHSTLLESARKVSELIGQLTELTGVKPDPSQVYVGGFSQGGLTSLEMAAEYPELVAGIIDHSGFISENAQEKLRAGSFRGKPAFVAHGTRDDRLPIERAHIVKEVLETGGVEVTTRNTTSATSPAPKAAATWPTGSTPDFASNSYL